MGKKHGTEASGQLPFDDFSSDGFESTTQVMTNRTRFEALDSGQRARLAESMVALDVRRIFGTGDDEQVRKVEDSFQETLSQMLDQVASTNRVAGCYFCHGVIGPEEASVQMFTTWMTDGRKVHSEPVDEKAHDRCVKRIREGGDPDAKPMF